jgi:hypothetical protein
MFGPKCQSCGMPLSKDPEKGGTEADRSKSLEYCSYCYKDGKFWQPDMTKEEMIAFCETKMKEMKMPTFMKSMYLRSILKLKRWNH